MKAASQLSKPQAARELFKEDEIGENLDFEDFQVVKTIAVSPTRLIKVKVQKRFEPTTTVMKKEEISFFKDREA